MAVTWSRPSGTTSPRTRRASFNWWSPSSTTTFSHPSTGLRKSVANDSIRFRRCSTLVRCMSGTRSSNDSPENTRPLLTVRRGFNPASRWHQAASPIQDAPVISRYGVDIRGSSCSTPKRTAATTKRVPVKMRPIRRVRHQERRCPVMRTPTTAIHMLSSPRARIMTPSGNDGTMIPGSA